MARYGVLGDIHGNREALEAVLRELDARGVRQLLCVGDIVGYNADPDECVALVRSRRVATIAGNHDLISQRRLDFSRCSNIAEYALRRTRRTLGKEATAWLAGLPRIFPRTGCRAGPWRRARRAAVHGDARAHPRKRGVPGRGLPRRARVLLRPQPRAARV